MRIRGAYVILSITLVIMTLGTSSAQKDKGHKLDDFKGEGETKFKDGIKVYDRFNATIGGDSTRMCEEDPCEGWMKDYHENGQLMHKGYYENGQIYQTYNNYYESGQLERNFRSIDDSKSKLKSYYFSGAMRSNIVYVDGSVAEWEDYYENGQLQYQEVNHKNYGYYLINKLFYDNGQPQLTMELIDKKKKIFDHKEFFKDGKPKEVGQVQFSEATYDYVRIGTWKVYDETGKQTKELLYNNGKIDKTTEF